MGYDVTVIGAAIVDVLASPADRRVFDTGSQPMEEIRLSFGGDALNEAVVLSRLGKKVQLISKVGDDEAGRRVLSYLDDNGISTDHVVIEPGLATGINIVLIDGDGERHFLTNPHSSLRRLDLPDIEASLTAAAPIISFASLFVSPPLTIGRMTELFRKIKSSGRLLFADTTKAKNGESLQDLEVLLPCLDFFVPNASEIALLTGDPDPDRNMQALLAAGVKTPVIKIGAGGCLVGGHAGVIRIPAVSGICAADSTGAGDAFAGGFLAGLSEGQDPVACAQLGCAAASCTVEQVGATEGIRSAGEIRGRAKHLKGLMESMGE